MLLELIDVVAGYGGGDVLRGVNLFVEQGTITCLVGPNGAGKSTVFTAISGIIRPRKGQIRFNGQDLIGLSPRQILTRGLVQVPQNHSLFPGMTVRENVELGAYMVSDQSIVRRVRVGTGIRQAAAPRANAGIGAAAVNGIRGATAGRCAAGDK